MRDSEKREMHELRPTVWIGKQGCTDTILEEICSQLKKRGVIKVRCLQTATIDPREIALMTGSLLVDARGKTLILREGKQLTKRHDSRNI